MAVWSSRMIRPSGAFSQVVQATLDWARSWVQFPARPIIFAYLRMNGREKTHSRGWKRFSTFRGRASRLTFGSFIHTPPPKHFNIKTRHEPFWFCILHEKTANLRVKSTVWRGCLSGGMHSIYGCDWGIIYKKNKLGGKKLRVIIITSSQTELEVSCRIDIASSSKEVKIYTD